MHSPTNDAKQRMNHNKMNKTEIKYFPETSEAITEEFFEKFERDQAFVALIGHPSHIRTAIVLGLNEKDSVSLRNRIVDNYKKGLMSPAEMFKAIFAECSNSFLKDADTQEELGEAYQAASQALTEAYNQCMKKITNENRKDKKTH